MKPEIKLVVVAVAISLGLTIGYNLLLPQKVREVVNTVTERVVGSAGNSYGEIVEFQDGASFAGGVLRGDGCAFPLGTTTPCALRSPTNATSSLLDLFVNVSKNATSSTRIMYISTSTVPYATSSTALISTRDIVANETFAYAATTSVPFQSGSSRIIFAPGTYINVNFKGGSHINGIGTTSELGGSASALFLTEGR